MSADAQVENRQIDRHFLSAKFDFALIANANCKLKLKNNDFDFYNTLVYLLILEVNILYFAPWKKWTRRHAIVRLVDADALRRDAKKQICIFLVLKRICVH